MRGQYGPMLRDRLAIEGFTDYYLGRVVITRAGKKIAQTERRRHVANRKRAAERLKARGFRPSSSK